MRHITEGDGGNAPVQGANYRAKAQGKKAEGHVALVLGAGNQTPVACMDILHKLFVDDAVVVCKMNPVNEYLGKFIRCCHCVCRDTFCLNLPTNPASVPLICLGIKLKPLQPVWQKDDCLRLSGPYTFMY